MTVKELKKGEYFTLKNIEYPKVSQVYIKDDYDRTEKGYLCYKFSEISNSRILKSDTKVYTDFIF